MTDRTRREFLKATVGAATLSGLAGCNRAGQGRPTAGETPTTSETPEPAESTPSPTTSTTAGTADPTEFRVWMTPTDEETVAYWKRTAEEFDETHPRIDLKATPILYETWLDYRRALGGMKSPALPHCLATLPGGKGSGEFSASDIVFAAEPKIVTDLYNRSEVKETASGTLDDLSIRVGQVATGQPGETIGVTVATEPLLSVWRRNWLDRAGIDPARVEGHGETPSELRWRQTVGDLYDEMTDTEVGRRHGRFPSATGMKESDAQFLTHYVAGHGGPLSAPLDPTGTHCILEGNPARRALELQREWVQDRGYWHENALDQGDEEHADLFLKNKLGEMHLQDAPTIWREFRDRTPVAWRRGQYRFAVPQYQDRKAAFATTPTCWAFEAPYENTAHEDAYVEWCDWLGVDRAFENVRNLGWLPLDVSRIDDRDYFTDDGSRKRFWSTAKNLSESYEIAFRSPVPGAKAIQYDIPFEMYQHILRDGRSIEEATSQACENIDDILREHDRYEPK